MFVECPHCSQTIEIIQLNCRIFRCGVYKTSFKQIDPHLSKSECTRLFDEKLIFGCGKPFRILECKPNVTDANVTKTNVTEANVTDANESKTNDPIIAVVCDYI
jgi:hypothetical protein